MQNRKIIVEQFNEGRHNSSLELFDPSNYFGGSRIEPANYTDISSEETINVFVTNSVIETEFHKNRFLTPKPYMTWKENLKMFLIFEEKEYNESQFVSKLVECLFWFGYRFNDIRFYVQNLNESELVTIKEALQSEASIFEYKNGWSLYFYNNNSKKSHIDDHNTEDILWEEITIPPKKRNRGLDIKF